MEQIVKIHNYKGQQLVDARELHKKLQSKKDFSSWVKNRIKQSEAIENKDYIIKYLDVYGNYLGNSLTQKGESDSQVHKKEYGLTIDMAKHWCLMEQTSIGKRIRDYFIEVEKKAIEMYSSLPNFNNPAEAARAWADQYEKRELAEKKIQELEPKARMHDTVISSNGNISMKEAANSLNQTFNDKQLGRNNLFKILREKKIFTGRIPYQYYIDREYFVVKLHTVKAKKSDNNFNVVTTYVTPKGMDFLYNIVDHYLKLSNNE
jgi:phage anti-repressor protein/phage antirepressor YoqD-like protein